MSIIVCGSMAFDNIAVFQDRFQNHILPDKVHCLNVSFFVPELRREYGGCAGNISYNLRLLGESPLPVATVGHDFDAYSDRLETLGIRQTYLRRIPDQLTATCFITTDLDDNQITAFHPGAMSFSNLNDVSDINTATLGIVAPDSRDGMLRHCQGFAKAKVPFIFDPGQAMPLFSSEDLITCLDQATYATFNDYEIHLACERTGHSVETLATHVEALIVTKGKDGSTVYFDGQRLEVPVVKAEELLDPTGCGDAYRAGLLYGLTQGWDWLKTSRLASLMGAIKIAHRGGQNHVLTKAQIGERFQAAFGLPLW